MANELASALGQTSDRFRDLLEDFEVVGTALHTALVRRGDIPSVRENVRAALVASTLGLTSIDHARRQYSGAEQKHREDDALVQAYVVAYKATKRYVAEVRSRLRPQGLPEPSSGVFTAAVVLERLPASFFSAHFMYRIGHRFEGHAIARLILEQIAWACAAHSLDTVPEIESIEANGAISDLKRFVPEAGRLYGLLSKKTHINYESHLEFLGTENGRNVIWQAYPRYAECADVMLSLGDLYGLVWELSQFEYIEHPEAVELKDGKVIPNGNRSFLEKKASCVSAIAEAERLTESSRTSTPRPLVWR